MRWLLYFCLLLSGTIACKQEPLRIWVPTENIKGLWLVTGVDSADFDPALLQLENSHINRFLYLQDDGSFTSDMSGQYDFGTYDLSNTSKSVLSLKSHTGSEYQYTFIYNVQEGMGYILDEISLPGFNNNKSVRIKCTVRGYAYPRKSDDPYMQENNKWRIPAAQPENDSLLVKRISNHIDFWLAFLASTDAQDQSTVNFKNFNTCFQFSSYGILLEDVKDWPPQFRSLFYNLQNAERAYTLIEDAIYKSKVPDNENAYQFGMEIFKKIQYYLAHPEEEAIKK